MARSTRGACAVNSIILLWTSASSNPKTLFHSAVILGALPMAEHQENQAIFSCLHGALSNSESYNSI